MPSAGEDLKELIARLDHLESKATPGEWSELGRVGITSAASDNMCIAQCWAYAGDQSGDGCDNRAFIISIRNAYAELRSAAHQASRVAAADHELRRLHDRVQQLEAELGEKNAALETIRAQLRTAHEAAQHLERMLGEEPSPQTPVRAPEVPNPLSPQPTLTVVKPSGATNLAQHPRHESSPEDDRLESG